MSTDNGGIVGSYAGTGTGETAPYLGNLGLMLNLRIPILHAMDEGTLNTLLNTVDTSVAVQNIDVTLKIPQFHIQLAFKFGKIAAANNKRLRNVMIIRPQMSGIDLGTGYAPDSAPVLQLPSTHIMTYGGLFETIPILRVTLFIRSFQVPGQTGFMPSFSNPTWGEGFPGGAVPQANAVFRTLTPKLGKIFSRLPSIVTAMSQYPDFTAAATSPSNFALAIHRDGTNIQSAWVIYPTSNTPIVLPLCSADKNDLSQKQTIGSTDWESGSDQACDCPEGIRPWGSNQLLPTSPQPAGTVDPCKNIAVGSASITGSNYVANKLPFLQEAINTRPTNPSTGYLALPTVAISGFTVSILP